MIPLLLIFVSPTLAAYGRSTTSAIGKEPFLPPHSPQNSVKLLAKEPLFALITRFLELKLVGGSGPHEGNILVGGLPVCDDGHEFNQHGMRNALVVCRFYNRTKEAAKNSTWQNIFNF